MAQIGKQELADLWYKILEAIRSELNMEVVKFVESQEYKLLTEIIIPLDYLSNKTLILYEYAHRLNKNSKKFSIHTEYWNKCLKDLKKKLPEQEFKHWFHPITSLGWDESKHELKLSVTDLYHAEFIDKNYSEILKPLFQTVMGESAKPVYIVIDENINKTSIPEEESLDCESIYTILGNVLPKLDVLHYECINQITDNSTYTPKESLEIIERIKKVYINNKNCERFKKQHKVGFDNVISINNKYKNTKIVKQSNKLNSAKYNLNLTQKKALLYCIYHLQNNLTQINTPLSPLKNFAFSLTPSQFKELGVGENSVQIKNNLLKIFDTSVELKLDNYGEEYELIHIFQSFKFEKKSFSISFSPEFIGLINQLALHKEYTILNCDTILSCKSYYTTRMYELCAQYRNSNSYVVKIGNKELRRILNCENKYLDYANFKKRCLDDAKRELDTLFESKKSDLTFEITPYKKGDIINGRREILTWHISIKIQPWIIENNQFLSNEKKEEFATSIISDMVEHWDISPFYLNEFKRLDFETKMKIVRELQFHFISINKNHDLFGQIFMETIPQTLGN